MAQTPFVESWHDFGFIVSLANGHRSIEHGVITGGVKVPAGTVAAVNTAGKYVPVAPTATDGTQTAVAIICQTVDATTVDATSAVVARDAEVNASELVWPSAATANQITASIASLKAVGIIAR